MQRGGGRRDADADASDCGFLGGFFWFLVSSTFPENWSRKDGAKSMHEPLKCRHFDNSSRYFLVVTVHSDLSLYVLSPFFSLSDVQGQFRLLPSSLSKRTMS